MTFLVKVFDLHQNEWLFWWKFWQKKQNKKNILVMLLKIPSWDQHSNTYASDKQCCFIFNKAFNTRFAGNPALYVPQSSSVTENQALERCQVWTSMSYDDREHIHWTDYSTILPRYLPLYAPWIQIYLYGHVLKCFRTCLNSSCLKWI